MLVVKIYTGPYSIMVSIVAGTGIGMIVKYLLDKRYIFKYRTVNLIHDGQTFFLYGTMGVFTTLIFWVAEWGFYWLFENKELRYIGAVIGLIVGYFVKYRLDKRFVFVESRTYS